MKNISIIIVTWRNDEVLNRCLDSLVGVYRDTLPEIIVVDNGNLVSTKKIVEQYSCITYVACKENLGFAGGNNVGLKYVHGDYILLLNDDTIFHSDSIYPLVDFLEQHASAGIAQGTMVIPGFGLDDCGTELRIIGIQRHLLRGCDPDSVQLIPRKVFAVKGAMLMFKRKVLESVGGFLFYDHFKSYYEETDFCHRAKNAGWESWFVPTPPIEHLCGATSSRMKKSDVWIQYIANILFSFKKNFGVGRRLITMSLFLVIVLFRFPVFTVKALILNAKRR